ncbi:DoxX family protein [Flavobacterium aquatile]|uniref:DoxX family protein n=1 Tax=Flavobacterium aquatile LMG 4008 = ATCC 11947 TaxID=1453498 RepID=A0A095UWN2_9FLAO|nr:DoxX family protein [Flavobacterium aquatile]KGD66985.1 DoxX family protein [Flavobacterium aquatile LMG 4008 = ATCC 11947]OXA68080.1 DoxX family protein [Flavobacterium aquatile] [Flavobacterium aquatile LMG 4008 = ATCC 11947]
MKKILFHLMQSNLGSNLNNFTLLLFRVAISAELIVAHGLKKLGIGVTSAEIVPNPFGLPEVLNQVFATSANIIMPLFIVVGLFTRLATLPILAVTLTGYFILHFNDTIAIKDVPFMYSVSFILIALLGPGKYSLDNYFTKK